MRPIAPLADRVAELTQHTDDEDGCWLWLGRLDDDGYGSIGEAGKTLLAHRAAYIVEHGAIPDGMNVCHRCDNPPCVRPKHLFLGTQAENIADMIAKGRMPTGAQRPNAKLNEAEVRSIRRLAEKGLSHRAIAEQVGVSRSLVTMVASGERWGHVAL